MGTLEWGGELVMSERRTEKGSKPASGGAKMHEGRREQEGEREQAVGD